jgi:hypothetical protein
VDTIHFWMTRLVSVQGITSISTIATGTRHAIAAIAARASVAAMLARAPMTTVLTIPGTASIGPVVPCFAVWRG